MKSRTMSNYSVPSPLEQKCLQHLDAPGSWKILRTSTPDLTDVLSWRPFRRVFGFNFMLFAVVFTGIFFGLETTAETGVEGLKEDLPYGIVSIIVLTISMATYVTHLYRRSWNKRARALQGEVERRQRY